MAIRENYGGNADKADQTIWEGDQWDLVIIKYICMSNLSNSLKGANGEEFISVVSPQSSLTKASIVLLPHTLLSIA